MEEAQSAPNPEQILHHRKTELEQRLSLANQRVDQLVHTVQENKGYISAEQALQFGQASKQIGSITADMIWIDTAELEEIPAEQIVKMFDRRTKVYSDIRDKHLHPEQ